ncbi:MAG: glycine--tRNA ligase subunit beta [Candidatus Cloacimonadaceae bacterium]|nr:glycine--tRNA ligase subunit beta [Candidatus Cloacimonadota bacterium]MDY0381593.1 glycine--tRNA ligase subunit beta [Candidatus Cloacimonadaceae bacterium]MCB5263197.1 glycine--tRNA ligase subunit beta [Candidatus Cloacimonadota bacterium]MCB5277347.1 glycine--tRNA ligase subunit beta [Candidatus Cloacimonadota bacterium]MCK9434624.1 glycine--tRNA ligase subunit beta [Candidatus Cloacimonadota bacterium]
MHSFLFELGIEELPDNVIVPAINSIRASFEKMLAEQNLSSAEIRIGSTPRRLAISCTKLPTKQADIEICKTGPSVNIAYDASGELSKAGMGFVRKSGAAETDVYIQKTEKGEFIAVRFVQNGRESRDILRDWIPEAISQIPLPKKMIWKSKNLAFSRPIRWIVAMWDTQVLDLDILGIRAGRISYGNRYLGLESSIEIAIATDYEEALAQNRVIVDRDKRRGMILDQFSALFNDGTFTVKQDERLLDTVCNLVEHPCAVVAEFDSSFLKLPEKIITSTISQNQKYFSVYDSDGNLSNKFVFVSNGDPRHSDIIKAGNQKVVAARLEDALWFFQEDCKRGLDAFVPHLKDVVFQSSLGTMADKTERILAICDYLCRELGFDDMQKHRALRTAQLCKADLMSLMLGEKEFAKLQGYMGMQYALAAGEDPEVAQAIYEHYMPRGSNDGLPESISGALCAVADKLDSVCGIIGVGQMPTGSADPFALRRAAGGLVQIVADRAWDIDLQRLIDYAFEILASSEVKLVDKGRDKVKSFCAQRVNWLLKEMGISYDIVASVSYAGFSRLTHLIAKARALEELRQDDRFIKLVIGYKRVSNIIEGEAKPDLVDPALFESDAERELYEGLSVLSEQIGAALERFDYPGALLILVEFGTNIDNFFDNVLVNCDEPNLKQNRHSLLSAIRAEFIKVADLSQIVVESNGTGE